jgi:MFS family permease
MGFLSRIVVDTSALKDSRDFRLLTLGTFVSSLGSQIALVALPYQVYIITGSSFQVGLIGLVELFPFVAAALFAGTLADRHDRRRLLMLAQLLLLCTSTTLAVLAATGPPPVVVLYVIAAIAAACSALDRPTRSAMVPNLVGLARLESAISLTYGLYQVSMVVGPALAGIIISQVGLTLAYSLDAATFVAMFVAAALLRPQPPTEVTEREPVLQSIRAGLRFAWSKGELMGSFVIDILAMTFGMPRALFPALALTVYHAGPTGVGLLYAALSAGAVVAAFTTGWLAHVSRLGRIVVVTVAIWGAGITVMGLTNQLWVAMVCLIIAGAADSISAVCRSTILQTATPDSMRGRMSSIFTMVVAGGPRLGDVESGTVAGAVGLRFSVVSGGILCMIGILPIVLAFPAFWRYGQPRTPEDPSAVIGMEPARGEE